MCGPAAPPQMLALSGLEIDCRCGPPSAPLLSPLHLAAREGHAESVELLLRHHADVTALADGGRTPLHTAAAGGTAEHAACARLLLRYGCDPLRTDLTGITASDLAEVARVERQVDDCARLLQPYSRQRYGRREHGDASPRPFMSALLVAE